MTNEVARKPAQPVANLELNYFQLFGSQGVQGTIRGRLLKFSKGDWVAGREEEEMEVGHKLVANMDELLHGWIKWWDNKPDQQIMGKISDGYRPPQRESLGDMDQNQWEIGVDGKPRNPWQFTYMLILKEVGMEGLDDEQLYTFSPSSVGGLQCMSKLMMTYGNHIRMHPDKFPIVELGVSSYPHKQFGKIKTPTLNVVEWEDKKLFEYPK